MQGLLKLHRLASKLAGESIDWTSICRAVVRTKPPYEANLGSMCSFVASKAGGPTGLFLKYLHSVHGQFVSAQKKQALPSGLYRVLADFPLHYVAIAIWEAAYTGPPEKVGQGGVCEVRDRLRYLKLQILYIVGVETSRS